jgi:AcrR family transcriptional regulator
VWTNKERATVLRLTGQGIGTREIAKILGTSPKTLRRHFGDVLVSQRSGPKLIEWTEEQRDSVQAMSGFGLNHEQIATVMRVSVDQLEAYFSEELALGEPSANARVATSLFQMATQDRIPSAAIFWLKARAGWQDRLSVSGKVEHEHSGEVEVHDTRAAVAQLDAKGRAALRLVTTQLGAESALSDDGPEDGEALH